MIEGAWKPVPDSSVLAATNSRFKALVNSVNSCFGASLECLAAIYSVMSALKQFADLMILTGRTL
jgi:hypothetical protein